MDMTGERRIAAPRQAVWNALNDPAVLKTAIPGCQTLHKVSDTDLEGTGAIKLGPVDAQFTGKVHVLDTTPTTSFRITGEGQGNAGFANGDATVHLSDDGAFTLLTYEVKANLGGAIAGLGTGVIDAAAKRIADQFFDRFSAEVSAPPAIAADGAAGAITAAAASTPPASGLINMLAMIPARPFGYPLVFWLGSAVFLVIFVLIFGSYVF